jgi:hypothetical protein
MRGSIANVPTEVIVDHRTLSGRSGLGEYLFPIRACALAPRRRVKRNWQGSASSNAASKTAAFRSPRSPSIGSAYAIGGHTRSIVVLSARADCARVLHIRALLAAGALNLSNK